MIFTGGYDSTEPPFEQTIKTLWRNQSKEISDHDPRSPADQTPVFGEQEYHKFTDLPRIDIGGLSLLEGQPAAGRKECEGEIVEAARDWGFFEIVNHGIPGRVIEQMKAEQKKVFEQSFEVKRAGGGKLNNLGADSYRWGNPMATCLRQMSWSEAFHIHITDISRIEDDSLRSAIEVYATVATALAEKIAEILARNLGVEGTYFQENCTSNSCYLRMNRYPPCPFPAEVFGLVPHTDSDFLTIVCEDGAVGGLQLMKGDGSWVGVSPNPDALVVNVGDLFQAWSNGVYKSVKHKVMASREKDRLSMAFFYCPKSETVIRSCINPSVYRHFSFREYQLQVSKDVQATGDKVGLSRFLL